METIQISRKMEVSPLWDVIVVGGGPSGCTAAAAAARAGAKTLILEQTGSLGGMGTQGLVPAWCPFDDGEKMIYRGLAETVFTRSLAYVPQNPKGNLQWVPIDCESLKRIYDEIVTENGAETLFHAFVCGVEKKSDREIDALIVADIRGMTAYRAKVFIDATGDGNIAAWAGAGFDLGEAGTHRTQDSTFCFQFDNVNAFYYQFDRRNSVYGGEKISVIQDVDRDPAFPDISAAHFCNAFCGPSTIGFNAGHFNFSPFDPEAISKHMILGRKLAAEYRDALAKHGPNAYGGAHVSATANLMGIREGRRIKGDYTLCWKDYVERRTFEDEIGRNCYYMDIHGGDSSITRELKAILDQKGHCEKGESHGIPYRSLVPADLDNVLLAGRCISADRLVYGSVRIMPVCLVTGEASGAAAAQAAGSGADVHSVDTKKLREELRAHGAWFK